MNSGERSGFVRRKNPALTVNLIDVRVIYTSQYTIYRIFVK